MDRTRVGFATLGVVGVLLAVWASYGPFFFETCCHPAGDARTRRHGGWPATSSGSRSCSSPFGAVRPDRCGSWCSSTWWPVGPGCSATSARRWRGRWPSTSRLSATRSSCTSCWPSRPAGCRTDSTASSSARSTSPGSSRRPHSTSSGIRTSLPSATHCPTNVFVVIPNNEVAEVIGRSSSALVPIIAAIVLWRVWHEWRTAGAVGTTGAVADHGGGAVRRRSTSLFVSRQHDRSGRDPRLPPQPDLPGSVHPHPCRLPDRHPAQPAGPRLRGRPCGGARPRRLARQPAGRDGQGRCATRASSWRSRHHRDRASSTAAANRSSCRQPAPAERAVTRVEREGETVAVLIHDPGLEAETPGLVGAAGSVAALALQNERLSAQVRAQLDEVRASRARIVEAGDAERQRIERDLHDGAQQRLVALALRLQTARATTTGASELTRPGDRRAAGRRRGGPRHRPRAAPADPHRARARGRARGAGRTSFDARRAQRLRRPLSPERRGRCVFRRRRGADERRSLLRLPPRRP